MSDKEPTEQASAAVQEFQALLERAEAKKNELDFIVASSNSLFESIQSKLAAIEEAKTSVVSATATALTEISGSKTSIAAAKDAAEKSLAEFDRAKGAAEVAKSAAVIEIEKSKNAVASARSQAEVAASEIEMAKTAAATARGAIEAIQKSANTDLASINEAKQATDKSQAAATAQGESLAAENAAIATKITELQKKAVLFEEILVTLTGVKEESEIERAQVIENVRAIKGDDGIARRFSTYFARPRASIINLFRPLRVCDIGNSGDTIRNSRFQRGASPIPNSPLTLRAFVC